MFVCSKLQDKSVDAAPGSFFQLLPRPPSPAMFHYPQPPGCSAEFNPRPASQPLQISTCYYNSPAQPPSSPCHYGSPVICHVPPEPSLQFNVASSALSPQHSKIPDIVLTGNCSHLYFKLVFFHPYKTFVRVWRIVWDTFKKVDTFYETVVSVNVHRF